MLASGIPRSHWVCGASRGLILAFGLRIRPDQSLFSSRAKLLIFAHRGHVQCPESVEGDTGALFA